MTTQELNNLLAFCKKGRPEDLAFVSKREVLYLVETVIRCLDKVNP